jgi:hypothetical protein
MEGMFGLDLKASVFMMAFRGILEQTEWVGLVQETELFGLFCSYMPLENFIYISTILFNPSLRQAYFCSCWSSEM